MDSRSQIIESIRFLKQRCHFEEEVGRRLKLTPRQMSAILAVQPGEQLGCGELAARMRLSPSRASRVIGGLMEGGYLERVASGRDRRCAVLTLSPKGEESRLKIGQAEEDCARERLALLNDEQVRQVQAGFRLLLDVL